MKKARLLIVAVAALASVSLVASAAPAEASISKTKFIGTTYVNNWDNTKHKVGTYYIPKLSKSYRLSPGNGDSSPDPTKVGKWKKDGGKDVTLGACREAKTIRKYGTSSNKTTETALGMALRVYPPEAYNGVSSAVKKKYKEIKKYEAAQACNKDGYYYVKSIKFTEPNVVKRTATEMWIAIPLVTDRGAYVNGAKVKMTLTGSESPWDNTKFPNGKKTATFTTGAVPLIVKVKPANPDKSVTFKVSTSVLKVPDSINWYTPPTKSYAYNIGVPAGKVNMTASRTSTLWK